MKKLVGCSLTVILALTLTMDASAGSRGRGRSHHHEAASCAPAQAQVWTGYPGFVYGQSNTMPQGFTLGHEFRGLPTTSSYGYRDPYAPNPAYPSSYTTYSTWGGSSYYSYPGYSY
jgi:hypothetical protein